MTRRDPPLTPVEVARFWEKVIPEPMSGCWLWLASTSGHGYGHMNSRKRKRTLLAHRISWRLERGPIPDGLLVLHKCDTPPCVNPSHLFLGTCSDNSRDMVNKNRHYKPPRGRWMPGHELKLTESQVAEMVALYKKTGKWRSTARQYGVAQGTFGQYLLRSGAREKPSADTKFLPGTKHPHSILTDEQVKSIRSALANGQRPCAVAQAHGITQRHVYMIGHRKTWTHL